MDIHDDKELDQCMRTAFDPDADSINRVVSAAMQPKLPGQARIHLAAASALTGVAIVAAIFCLRPAEAPVEKIRLKYVDNAVLIEFPDGSSKIMSHDTVNQGSPISANIIILEGDLP